MCMHCTTARLHDCTTIRPYDRTTLGVEYGGHGKQMDSAHVPLEVSECMASNPLVAYLPSVLEPLVSVCTCILDSCVTITFRDRVVAA